MTIRLPCPTCSGARYATHEDRHAATDKDVCRTCGGEGTIPAATGESAGAAYVAEGTPEMDRLVARLCHDPRRTLVNLNIFPGDGPQVTAEALAGEINRSLDRVESGEVVARVPGTRHPPRDVREWVAEIEARDEHSAAFIAESDAWDRAGERAAEIADYVMGFWWAGQPYQTPAGREIGMEERREQVRLVALKVLLGQMPDGWHMRFVPRAAEGQAPAQFEMPEASSGLDTRDRLETGPGEARQQQRHRASPAPDLTREAHRGSFEPVIILYENWRGETAVRRIVPGPLWFGSTEWHPEPGWLLTADEPDTGKRRDFALSGVRAWGQAAVDAALATYQQRARANLDHITLGDGTNDPTDLDERRDRFAEEALEIVQSLNGTLEGTIAQARYTFGRPAGAPAQELGGVMTTLACLASHAGLDMAAAGERELARCWTPEVVAKIRRKRANRHGRGVLPGDDADLVTTPTPEPGQGAGEC